MHGSTCIPLEEGFTRKGHLKYRCNCTEIAEGHYVGYQCDYNVTNYCIEGDAMNVNAVSFCANGQCSEPGSEEQM